MLPLIPLILIGSSLLFGAKKGYDALSDNEKAQKKIKKAKHIFDKSKRKLSSKKTITQKSLEELGRLKLLIWSTELRRFVILFDQIKNIELRKSNTTALTNKVAITKEEFKVYKEISLNAKDLVVNGLSSAGTGALVGIASYGGAMMFATASTGTAISTISGVTATNATLAWFGGGSLAAGGLGMTGGTLILGGLAIGPALAIGGLLLSAKARKNLAAAKIHLSKAKLASEKMETAWLVLDGINSLVKEVNKLIERFKAPFNSILFKLEGIIKKSGKDFTKYTLEEKEIVYLTLQYAQTLKNIIETPILTKKGAANSKSKTVFNNGLKFLSDVNK